MKKTIKKLYTATTPTSFKDALRSLIDNDFAGKVITDRDRLTVIVEYDEDNIELNEAAIDAIDKQEATCTLLTDSFKFTDDVEADAEFRVAELHMKLEKAIEDRDMYQKMYRDKLHSMDRISEQVRSIGVLLNSICPPLKR